MDERAALRVIDELVAEAGDDAAFIDGLAIATDMLHAETDYPSGVTSYTVGWRTIAVSLSDLAAVGAIPMATLAVYAPVQFEEIELSAFVEGASEVSALVGARYVGGDLDTTSELTTVGIALGRTTQPVTRNGARVGDAIVVSGTLGRGALGVKYLEGGDVERGNKSFRFTPRVETGMYLATHATSMIDSSDGLARSLHQLAEASGVGMAIERQPLPIDERLTDVADGEWSVEELGLYWGEDFELVATLPAELAGAVLDGAPADLTKIGEVVPEGVSIDGEALPDRGYTHG